jgi:riboflavin biosynthesis pyrimidine reductase
MMASVDGRILVERWRPRVRDTSVYERLHDQLAGDAWLVGRVTGQEFTDRSNPYPRSDARIPRENWFAQNDAEAWAVVVDAHGKIAWGMSDIDGDPIVVLLTNKVADSHLAGLRDDGVSYIFAGDDDVDFRLALETLNQELGIRRVLLEGGGGVNGSLLAAGLVDELSLLICPAVDGSRESPSVFDVEGETDALPVTAMSLLSCEQMDGGFVWLRYRIFNG